MAVVDAADEYGSTDYIVKAIEAAPAGDAFAIGTEINLVQRLAAEYPAAHDLLPRPGGLPVLDDVPHPPRLPRLGARGARRAARCSTASRCRDDVAAPARVALERMLAARPDTTMAA